MANDVGIDSGMCEWNITWDAINGRFRVWFRRVKLLVRDAFSRR